MPLAITGVMGLTFGGGSGSNPSVSAIPFTIVDEDDSVIGQFLRSIAGQSEFKEHFQINFASEVDARRQMDKNNISALLIIPEGFSEAFFQSQTLPELTLIKNPAQSFYPAIVEEFVGLLTEILNAFVMNFGHDLPKWTERIEELEQFDLIAISQLMYEIGTRIEKADDYLFPPLVSYEVETRASASEEQNPGVAFNLFGFLLPMLTSMFLLFVADTSARDIHKESQLGTLNRYRCLNCSLTPLILSKTLQGFTICLISGAFIFLAGSIIFGIHWEHPIRLIYLIACYSWLAACLLALLVALAKTPRRSETLNTLLVLSIAFLGGSVFPVSEMPDFLANHIAPLLPNYWFTSAVHQLEFNQGDANWTIQSIKMISVGGLCLWLSANLMKAWLEKGGKA